VFPLGCDLAEDDSSFGMTEEQPPDPCDDLWHDVFDSCMESGSGFGCFEMLQPCDAEANMQYVQCCQGVGLSVSLDPVRSCKAS
jgi:hypothetical protein